MAMEQRPLAVTVFASASRATPSSYLRAARELGYALARAGHTCINGGGDAGCMGSLNGALSEADGKVRGVIHKTFIGEDAAMDLKDVVVVEGDDLADRKRGLFEG